MISGHGVASKLSKVGLGIALAALLAMTLGPVFGASAAAMHRRGNVQRGGCVRVLAAGNQAGDAIDALVADGTLTSAQAEAVKAALVNGAKPAVKACAGAALIREAGVGSAVSDLLGMDRRELRSALRGGQSLAEIAQSKGITREQLTGAINDAIGARLDELVTNGKLTADRKAQIQQDVSSRIDEAVDYHAGDRRSKRNAGSATPAATPAGTPVAIGA